MHWIRKIIFCVLFGLATCDIECFKESLSKCHNETDHIKDMSYCGLQPFLTGCVSVAATECKKPFADAAKKADDVLTDFCTEGKPFFEALKNDENCDMHTFSDPDCDPQGNVKRMVDRRSNDEDNLYCENLGSNRECMFEHFKKCSTEDAQKAFQTLYESMLGLFKGLCYLNGS
ncbi:uncharacterized protein [Parasteatoda tepidariorum]|uniref:uncharacterized protein isoform X1 n=1 Tax=Parasteatoda tepidariorum TaxID=114398 RepID=UPI00077F9549|nr:uncharacterized protein LOC107440630 [Parasteatoda tepidariorum]